IYSPGAGIGCTCFWINNNYTCVVRIIIMVPVIIWIPWIIIVNIVVRIIITIVIIIIIQIRPAGAVHNFHSQVAVLIIFVAALVITVIIFFNPYIFSRGSFR